MVHYILKIKVYKDNFLTKTLLFRSTTPPFFEKCEGDVITIPLEGLSLCFRRTDRSHACGLMTRAYFSISFNTIDWKKVAGYAMKYFYDDDWNRVEVIIKKGGKIKKSFDFKKDELTVVNKSV